MLRAFRRLLGPAVAGVFLWIAAASSAEAQVLKVIVRDPGTFGTGGATGTVPFDAGAGAGFDVSATDHVVRTLDFVRYDWSYSVNGVSAANVTFTSTLPGHPACGAAAICAQWQALPPQCGAGSSISADLQTLVCVIGPVASGSTTSINPTMRVLATAPNGLTILPSVTMSGTDAGGAAATASAASGYSNDDGTPSATPVDTVSAAPIYDLAKVAGAWRYSSTGIGSGPGWFVTPYVSIRAAAGAGGAMGTAPLTSAITFTDTLSGPVAGTLDGCGPSGSTSGANGAQTGPTTAGSLPGGLGGGHNQVVNSGLWTCSQPGGPGTPISISIAGADTSGAGYPDTAANGAAGLPPGYVVTGYVTIFYAFADVNAQPAHSATATDVFSAMVATSNSGASIDPVSGNQTQTSGVDATVVTTTGNIGFGKAYSNVSAGVGPLPGEAVFDDGKSIVVPGQQFNSLLSITNAGYQPFVNAIVCDKIDATKLSVRDVSPGVGVDYVTTFGQPARTPIIQYAASANLPDAAHATCGTAGDNVTDGPWYNTTTAVPGGNAAITKVRVIDNTDPFNGYLRATVALTVKAGVPNDTTIPNWASALSPASPDSAWQHGSGTIGATYTSPFNCSDARCDRVTVMNELVRVVKDTVPSSVHVVGAGQTVSFVLSPTLTSGLASPAVSHVTVVDTLPAGLAYVAGSASIAPAGVVVNADGTTTITWNLGAVTPNTAIAPITLNTVVSPLVVDQTPLANRVVVSSDLDRSDAALRSWERDLTISNPGGLSVVKTPLSPTVHPNDPISYLLSYNNTGATAIASTDFIDVLPAATNSPASSYAGTLSLASLTGANGENFFYATAAPATINADAGCQSNGGLNVGASCTANTVPNSTPWTACPGNVCPAAVTAIRAKGGAFPIGAAARSLSLTLAPAGNAVGNTYWNYFTGRSDVGALAVTAQAVAVVVTSAPLIDIVKSAAAPVAVGGPPNTYDVAYTLVVKNTGASDDTNVQIVDDLAAVYGGAANVASIAGLTASAGGGSSCSPYPLFNGTTSTNLLAGSGTIRPGETCTIAFTARVVNAVALNNAAGSTCTPKLANQYCNSASATSYTTPPGTPGGTGTGPQATDTSTNATTPPATHDTTTSPTPTTLAVPADMSPALSALPTAIAPGAAVSGVLTCTNAGPATAAAAICSATAKDSTNLNVPVSVGSCVASAGSSLANVLAGGTLTCPISFTAPGTPGGSDSAATSITVTGVTGATNDTDGGLTTGGNNSVSTPLPIVDAVDDAAATLAQAPSGTTSYPLIANDTVGAAAAVIGSNVSVPTLSNNGGLTGATIDAAGKLIVPNSTPTGSYTITYRLCAAPAATPAACDTATLQITVTGIAPDMSAAYTGLPAAAAPGATVTGALVCTNAASAAANAIAATCVPGPGVTLTGVCVASAGSAASLPPGATLSCPVSAIAPPNGQLALTGTTSATNETNLANDNASAVVPVIDAVNDPAATLPVTGGNVPLYGNDTLGGNPVAPLLVTSSIVNPGGLPSATTIDPSTGALVVPSGAAPGTYTVTYRICTKAPGTIACDTATVIVILQGGPDLTVRKTHLPATFTERNPGSYRIVASNAGSLATSGSYVVVDTLPAGMTIAALPVGNGWDCSTTVVGSHRASCSSGTAIAPGADNANAITLSVNVGAGLCAAPDSAGVCAGSNFVNNVVVIGGGEPSTATGNDSFADPTPIQQAASVTGQVWLDLNHDRIFDAGDIPKSGFVVEVLHGGVLQATGTTDSSGNYTVSGLVPGSGYGVRFKDPASGAYYGRPLSNDPAGGNDPSAASTTGVVAGGEIQNLTLGYTAASGSTLRTHQSLPLDPNGVVYDSITRLPVAGATVTLQNADGSTVSARCVVGGATSVQTAVGVLGDVDGGYSFVLMNPVPAGCAGAADYRLKVTPPGSYALSTLIPAQTGTLHAPVGCLASIAGVCVVQQQAGPPPVGQPTPYYLTLHLDPALGPDVVDNQIPLDPALPAGLVIAKTGDHRSVELGDSLRYAITIQRTDHGGNTLAAVEVVDTLPAGFRYIAGTAMVGTTRIADPAGAPGSVLRFEVGALPAAGQVTLYYRIRAGVGSMEGSGINRARASIGANVDCNAKAAQCSNEARYAVTVTGGVFTTDGCIVGRVFVDANNNHVKDPEELGIPGVRLYMEDGAAITTDVEGKYSRCSLAPMTHVIVVDQTTLPRGSRLTTSSNRNAGDAGSLFIDLTNGSLQRADFIEGSASATVLEQVKARRTQGEVNAPATEKKGGQALKFVGKPVTAPQQATDGADQRAVKPR
ncbi:MAG TPA: SdrD B-like domain-containing protein [Burkholderiaceae bacterium]